MKAPPVLGILGCGERLRGILNACLARDPSLRVAAVYDPDADSAQSYRTFLGDAGRVCATEGELVGMPGLDWVWIGSPNSEHARQAVLALEAGKSVFCEKPLATTVADCLRIRDAVLANQGRFVFGLVLRHSPFYRKLRALLDAGTIGRLVSFEFNETLSFEHGGYIMGNWRRHHRYSGGHLLEKCCHDVDIANWLCGSVPVRVASFGGLDIFRPENAGALGEQAGRLADGRSAYAAWKDRRGVDPFLSDKDTVDNQVAIFEYANGVRASFHTNTHSALPERRIMLIGLEGALRANLLTGEIEVRRNGFNELSTLYRFPRANGHGDGDGPQADQLLAVMRGQAQPRAGIHEALRGSIACLAAEEAMQSGTVVDLRPLWQAAGLDPDGA